MTGDAAGDDLTITVSSDVLEHNRFGVDPGFASAQDFDSTHGGHPDDPKHVRVADHGRRRHGSGLAQARGRSR